MVDRLRQRARELRTAATDAERVIWTRIRRRQLKNFRFRRQHPIDHYIADFACIEAMLVIELDGSQHLEQAAADARRTKDLELAGYCVLRFWNDEALLRTDDVIEAIFNALPD